MRRLVLSAAAGVLLVGPSVLAFFTGGYFDGPRAWAGLLAWGLVAVAAALGPVRLPRTAGARLAIGGLGALAGLSLLSMLWAPLVSPAYHASQIVLVYLGVLLAATLLLSTWPRWRLVEPVLAGGVTVVIGYGLAGRLLPGLLHFARSVSAQGRLEQPLTYWNATGELAALGLVLCAGLVGARHRPAWMRGVAAAALVPLGAGLYVSFSRGALFAAAAGLLSLAVLARSREQLRAVLLAVAVSTLAAVAVAPFAGVTGLTGALSSREQDGAIVLVLLIVLAVGSVLAERLLLSRRGAGRLLLPPRAPILATGVICLGLAVAIILGAKETSTAAQTLPSGVSRLVTLQSNRYDYWRVALRAFASQPLHGVGAGNWSVYWLRWRKISEFAQDAHSLPLQVLAELGVLGAGALLAFLVGVGLAGQRALRAGRLAAVPIAGLVTYLVHAPLDWDWQMPAVTLVAIILAGTVLAAEFPEALPAVAELPEALADPSPAPSPH